ncbi:hypothetical protein QFZ73_001598 [Peribacillus sp. V2I11]|nr:hypothetical protein [Peribacillus sp. V2I11]
MTQDNGIGRRKIGEIYSEYLLINSASRRNPL